MLSDSPSEPDDSPSEPDLSGSLKDLLLDLTQTDGDRRNGDLKKLLVDLPPTDGDLVELSDDGDCMSYPACVSQFDGDSGIALPDDLEDDPDTGLEALQALSAQKSPFAQTPPAKSCGTPKSEPTCKSESSKVQLPDALPDDSEDEIILCEGCEVIL